MTQITRPLPSAPFNAGPNGAGKADPDSVASPPADDTVGFGADAIVIKDKSEAFRQRVNSRSRFQLSAVLGDIENGAGQRFTQGIRADHCGFVEQASLRPATILDCHRLCGRHRRSRTHRARGWHRWVAGSRRCRRRTQCCRVGLNSHRGGGTGLFAARALFDEYEVHWTPARDT
jgi:hypothetical protein